MDVLGNVTEFAYDGLGRVVTTTRTLDGRAVQTVTAYDALANRLSETDANGHTTSYSYDSLNRLATTTSHEGVTSSQTYNAAGWVLTSSDGLNHTTTNTYDDLGRLVSTTYAYDDLDRLASVTENDTGGAQTDDSNVLTRSVYDALGNRLDIVKARGVTATHTVYDGLTRPV